MLGILEGLYGTAATGWMLALIVVAAVWKLIWYGWALFKTVERKQKAWFIILFVTVFVLNDFGILALAYLAFNRKKNQEEPKKQENKQLTQQQAMVKPQYNTVDK